MPSKSEPRPTWSGPILLHDVVDVVDELLDGGPILGDEVGGEVHPRHPAVVSECLKHVVCQVPLVVADDAAVAVARYEWALLHVGDVPEACVAYVARVEDDAEAIHLLYGLDAEVGELALGAGGERPSAKGVRQFHVKLSILTPSL